MKFFIRVTKFLAFSMGVIVIFIGITFAALKLLIEQNVTFQNYLRSQISNISNNQFLYDDITLQWQLRGPELGFSNIQIINQNRINFSTNSELFFRPNLWNFLFNNNSPIGVITIDQAVIDLDNGALTENQQSSNQVSGEIFVPLNCILLINDLDLNINGGNQEYHFSDLVLFLQIGKEQIAANIIGENILGIDEIEVFVETQDFRFDSLDFFIEARGVSDNDISILLEDYINEEIFSGSFDASIWAGYREGSVVTGSLSFQSTDNINLLGSAFDNIAFDMEWERLNSSTNLFFSNIDLNQENAFWAENAYLDLNLTRNGELSSFGVTGNYFDATFLNLLSENFLNTNSNSFEMLSGVNFEGVIEDYQLLGRIDSERNIEIESIRADHFNFSFQNDQFSLLNLSGELDYTNNQIDLGINTTDISLNYENSDIYFEELNGQITYAYVDDKEVFSILGLYALIDDEEINLSSELSIDDKNLNSIALNAQLSNLSLNKYVDFIGPLGEDIFEFELLDGQIENLALEIQFTNNDNFLDDEIYGSFNASFLQLSSPVINREINLNNTHGQFFERDIHVEGRGGVFSRDDIFQLNLNFSDTPIFNLVSTNVANAFDLHEVYLALARSIPTIRYEDPSYEFTDGDINLNIGITTELFPLNIIDYQIDSNFTDLELEFINNSLRVNDIAGSIFISPLGIQSSNMEAKIYEELIEIEISEIYEFPYDSQWILNGRLFTNEIMAIYFPDWAPFIEANAYGSMVIKRPSIFRELDDQSPKMLIEISSNLEDFSINMPEPFSKSPQQSWNLFLNTTYLNNNEIKSIGRINDEIFVNMNYRGLQNQSTIFENGVIQLNQSLDLSPVEEGLFIIGSTQTMDLADWIAFNSQQNTNSNIKEIDINIINARMNGVPIGTTSIHVVNNEGNASYEIFGDDIIGNISSTEGLSGSNYQIELQKMAFNPDQVFRLAPSASLDNFIINIDNFYWQDRLIGNLEITANTENDILTIEDLSLVNQSYILEMNGIQVGSDDSDYASQVNFQLTASDVSNTLDNLAVDLAIEGNYLYLNGELVWQDNLSNWQSDTLEGQIQINLSEGLLPNLDPGAGRIAGLMSFTALPRRLAFDFRDVFSPGLSYDEISADYLISSGIAYTENFLLSGPIADISITGNLDIVNESYLQLALVSDDAGDALPSIGFFAGPGVGTALLLFSQIFKQPIQGISRAAYCISGNWEDPLVELITGEIANSNCQSL